MVPALCGEVGANHVCVWCVCVSECDPPSVCWKDLQECQRAKHEDTAEQAGARSLGTMQEHADGAPVQDAAEL